jgi:hypothetical protein
MQGVQKRHRWRSWKSIVAADRGRRAPGGPSRTEAFREPEDIRPSLLRPEVMPAAKAVSVEPRLRQQAIPEKTDTRFRDLWARDLARALGERAVRREIIRERLVPAIRGLAEWSALRHEVDAERESVDDHQEVATAEAKIKEADSETKRRDAEAEEEAQKAERYEQEAKVAAERRTALRPALRGSWWDWALLLLGNAVVLAVDVFVLHLGLALTIGSNGEHWITALLMGAGAVVVCDVLAWIAAAGTIRADDTFKHPPWQVLAAIAALSAVAVWFFVDLGDFRGASLQAQAHRDGLQIANPSFFTLGQVLFLIGAAVLCFSYFARRPGRELLRRQRETRKQCDIHLENVKRLHREAEEVRRVAAEVPVRRDAAAARIKARGRIAKAAAQLDRQEGVYQGDWVVVESEVPRADVEIGRHYWFVNGESQAETRTRATDRIKPVRIGLPALLASAATLIVAGSLAAAAITGLAVAAALILGARGRGASETDERVVKRDLARAFKAEIEPTSTGGGRASDIDRLVPLASNGHHESITPDELRKAVSDE